MSHSLLGDLLTSEGLLSEAERRQLIAESGSIPASFAKSILLNNILDDYELSAIIANNSDFEMAPADFGQIVDERAFYALDKNLITALEVMPLSFTDNSLRVAMLDPLDRETIRQLEFFSGRKIQALISPRAELYDAIKNWVPDFTPLNPPNFHTIKTMDEESKNDDVLLSEVTELSASPTDSIEEASIHSESIELHDANIESDPSEIQSSMIDSSFELDPVAEPNHIENTKTEENEDLDGELEALNSQFLENAENVSNIDLPEDENLINFDQFVDLGQTEPQELDEDSFDTILAPTINQPIEAQNFLENMNVATQVEDLTELFFEIPIEQSTKTDSSNELLEVDSTSKMDSIDLNLNSETDEEIDIEEVDIEVDQELGQVEEIVKSEIQKDAIQKEEKQKEENKVLNDEENLSTDNNDEHGVPAILEEKFEQITPRPPFSHTVTAIAALNHARTKLNLCRSADEAYSVINSTLRKLGIEQALFIKSENMPSDQMHTGIHFYCRTESFVPISFEQSAIAFREADENLKESWSNLGALNFPLLENLAEENTEICGIRMVSTSIIAFFICSWLKNSAQSATVKNDLLALLIRLIKIEAMFKK